MCTLKQWIMNRRFSILPLKECRRKFLGADTIQDEGSILYRHRLPCPLPLLPGNTSNLVDAKEHFLTQPSDWSCVTCINNFAGWVGGSGGDSLQGWGPQKGGALPQFCQSWTLGRDCWPSQVLYPTNSRGEVCGQGAHEGKPYMMMFDITRCRHVIFITSWSFSSSYPFSDALASLLP